MGHFVIDESFALSMNQFRRVGHADLPGFWITAAATAVPWIGTTIVGYLGGQFIPSPQQFGLDVVFPAAMIGLAIGLIDDRRDVLAMAASVMIALPTAIVIDPRLAAVAGGIAGPILAVTFMGHGRPRNEPDQATTSVGDVPCNPAGIDDL